MQERITYVKRCLSKICVHRQQCEHGKTQMRFLQAFPKGIEEVPDFMLNYFRAINPVSCVCDRWKMNGEQCIELQNKYQLWQKKKSTC